MGDPVNTCPVFCYVDCNNDKCPNKEAKGNGRCWISGDESCDCKKSKWGKKKLKIYFPDLYIYYKICIQLFRGIKYLTLKTESYFLLVQVKEIIKAWKFFHLSNVFSCDWEALYLYWVPEAEGGWIGTLRSQISDLNKIFIKF